MTSKRINILIYAGPSTSLPSVRHATWTLRRLLGAQYSIQTISSDQLLKEPWPSTCALLIIPGGADSGYCRILNGAGNRRIKAYVQGGGRYLGLCAGGYYGCSKCEFEVGRKGWEVVGTRELGFYPGVCRGLAFQGFVYGSEAGARAVKLSVKSGSVEGVEGNFTSYYNGGGVFVDAEKFKERGVEVLATFEEDLAVESGEGKAAVVYCAVGQGSAILTGPHPEYVTCISVFCNRRASLTTLSQIRRHQPPPRRALKSSIRRTHRLSPRHRRQTHRISQSLSQQARPRGQQRDSSGTVSLSFASLICTTRRD